MPSKVPQVVDNQVVDIDVSGGIDAFGPEESAKFTSGFLEADNVVHTPQGLSVRPGFRPICATAPESTTYVSTTLAQRIESYRNKGLVAFGAGYMYQLNESASTVKMSLKGPVPLGSVTSEAISSAPGGNGMFSGVMAVAATTRYKAVAHPVPYETQDTNYTGQVVVIAVADMSSGNVVRRYRIGDKDGQYRTLRMVAVDDRYLHVYVTCEHNGGGTGGHKPKMTVIDTSSLPDSSSSFTYTDVTGSSIGDGIAGVVPVTNASIVVLRGATCRIEKFNNSRASVANGTIANISATGFSDYGSGGTNFIVGGTNAGSYVAKVVDSSLSVTATDSSGPAVSGTTGDGELRVVAGGSAVYAVSYQKVADQNSTYIPCPTVFSVPFSGAAWTVVMYLPNWRELSEPFLSADGSSVRIHMAHQMVDDTVADYVAHTTAVINISRASQTTTPSTLYPRHRSVEAVLGEYSSATGHGQSLTYTKGTGAAFYNKAGGYRPSFIGSASNQSDTYAIADVMAHAERSGATLSSPQSIFVDMVSVSTDPRANSFDRDCMSGAAGIYYDGETPQEFGFISAPSISAKYTNSYGSLPAGQYSWLCVFSYTGADGQTHYSRTSRPVTLTTVASGGVNVQVVAPTVTFRTRPITVSLYRTVSGGTQYYLTWRATMSTTAGTTTDPSNEVFMTMQDSTLDAVLAAQPLLYRQPGTQGTALDRYHAVAGSTVCCHKDRVFMATGSRVYYSSFAVPNEAPWFNPAFSFDVPGGDRIVHMVSMLGRLVVFKRDSVWVVDGDGPPENGGSGAEFSPPARVHGDYGCLDNRFVASTPIGVFYRSKRGLELLGRDLSVTFVGKDVKRVTDAWYGSDSWLGGGACFDRKNGRVIFFAPLAASLTTFQALVYSMHYERWVTWTMPANPYSPTSICYANSVDDTPAKGWNVYVLFPGTGGKELAYLSDSTSLDKVPYSGSDAHVPVTLTTGWVTAGSKQERIRIKDLLVLGTRNSNFNLKCQVYSDWNKSTATTIKTYTASDTTLTPVQLEFQPAKESVQSAKFKLTTETPTVNTSLGSGKQFDLVGLTVRLGLRGGGAKLPSAQKG